MAAPVAPEALAPAAVKNLKIVGQADGVLISWLSPETDQRGADLKSIDGYKIYKKTAKASSVSSEAPATFAQIANIQDQHIVELNKQAAELRAQGKPGRRAKIDAALKTFSYLDKQVQLGSTYIYKLVPYNQGTMESSSFDLISINWKGSDSAAKILDSSELSADEISNIDEQ